MGHLNIRSVASKTEQLEQLLTNSNFDLLCLSETWLTESSPNTAYLVPVYSLQKGSKIWERWWTAYVRERLH